MRIRFQFNAEAAVQAAAYLLGNSGGAVDKVKLTKLLYLRMLTTSSNMGAQLPEIHSLHCHSDRFRRAP